MSAVLYDAAGPRGRRRILLGSAAAGLVVALVVVVAVKRLADKGQFEADLWTPFLNNPDLQRLLAQGILATLRAAVVAGALSAVAGAALALARLSLSRPVRVVATAEVEFFRGLPLLLLIVFCAFGLPRYGIDLPTFWYLVLGLTLYNSAVLSEIFRAGILSLPRGQSEAAYAVGLTYWQSMLLVVVPQAVRRMLPSLISQFVTLLKDTSLGFVIAYEELLRRAGEAVQVLGNPIQMYLVVALMYIAVCYSLSLVARRLEGRQRRKYGGGPILAGDPGALGGIDGGGLGAPEVGAQVGAGAPR